MPIEKLDEKKCNGCGICFACCPQDVFRLDDAKGKAYIKYAKDCVACWACESFCPVGAIEVTKERAMDMPSVY